MHLRTDAVAATARRAIVGVFFLNGIVLTTWYTRIPAVKDALHLSAEQLGFALVAPAAGSLVSMQFAGRLTARFGSGPVTRVVATLLPLPLVGAAVSDTLGWLVLSLLTFGIIDGLGDVFSNAHGIAVERALRRPVMNGLHASWTLGGIAGSSAAGLAVAAGVGVQAHFAVMAAVVAVGQAGLTSRLLPGSADRRPAGEQRAAGGGPGEAGIGNGPSRSRWTAGWSLPVALLGMLAFCCMLGEGAANWSGVFLIEQRGTSPAVAALGFIAFNTLMTVGRLVGDRLHARVGPVRLVRTAVVLGTSSLVAGLAVPVPAVTIAAFGLFGLGLSVVVPILVSAAGHGGVTRDSTTAAAGASVAKITTISYVGLLSGPALIGWLGQQAGLTAALMLPAVLTAAVALGAGATVAAAPRLPGPQPELAPESGPA